MTTESPREWWIVRWSEDWLMNSREEAEDLSKDFDAHEIVHVIEYSAYESLEQSLILAKKQRDEWNVRHDEVCADRDRLRRALEGMASKQEGMQMDGWFIDLARQVLKENE